MKLISDFYLFFLRKKNIEIKELKTVDKFKCIIVLILVNYVFLLLITLIKHLLINYGVLTPLADNFNNIKNVYKLIFFSVILGPLLEEIAFRLWFIYNKFNIFLSAGVLLYFILGKFHYLRNSSSVQILVIIIFSLFLFILLYLGLKYNEDYFKRKWTKNLRVFIVLSAVIFGYMHITNFRITENIILFSPLILSPIIFGGLVLGYIRVRWGFKFAYLSHMLQNLIPTLFIIFFA